MKATAEKIVKEPGFVPIELKITLETQEEVDRLFAVFNNSHIWREGAGTRDILHPLSQYAGRGASRAGDVLHARLMERYSR